MEWGVLIDEETSDIPPEQKRDAMGDRIRVDGITSNLNYEISKGKRHYMSIME